MCVYDVCLCMCVCCACMWCVCVLINLHKAIEFTSPALCNPGVMGSVCNPNTWEVKA